MKMNFLKNFNKVFWGLWDRRTLGTKTKEGGAKMRDKR